MKRQIIRDIINETKNVDDEIFTIIHRSDVRNFSQFNSLDNVIKSRLRFLASIVISENNLRMNDDEFIKEQIDEHTQSYHSKMSVKDILSYAYNIKFCEGDLENFHKQFKIDLIHDNEFKITNYIDSEEDYFSKVNENTFLWDNNYSDEGPQLVTDASIEFFNDEGYFDVIYSEEA